MKEVKIEKIEDFKKFVESLEVGVKYLLPDNCRYAWLKIEKEKDWWTEKISFGWTMEYNYSVSRVTGYIFPLESSGNKVKTFKTENGAKRNFIKRYADYFESDFKNH